MNRTRLCQGLPVLLTVWITALPGTGRAEATKCKAAINKSAATYAQKTIKAIVKCEEIVVKDKGLGAFYDCQMKAGMAIGKAQDKAYSDIARACGAKDKQCGTNDEGEDTMASIGWDINCPNLENSTHLTCSKAINDCLDIGYCLICVAEEAVDHAIALSYEHFNLPSKADKVTSSRSIACRSRQRPVCKARPRIRQSAICRHKGGTIE